MRYLQPPVKHDPTDCSNGNKLESTKELEIADRELTSDEMLAAARQDVLGDVSPSEQILREARERFESEQPDSFSDKLAEAAAREREALAETAAAEFRFEEPLIPEPRQPSPRLTTHSTGPRPRRAQSQQELPPDPFTRQPRVSRRLRRLIPLVIVAFVVINAVLDTDIGTQLQNLWNEIFGGGSSGSQ